MDSSRLAAIPLFRSLDPEHLEALASVASETVAVVGQRLATQGEFGHALYAIEAGTAEVVLDGQVAGTLGPGDVFGEIAVLAAGRRTATVVASSPMTLIAVFKRDVWALDRHSPATSGLLRQLVADRLAR